VSILLRLKISGRRESQQRFRLQVTPRILCTRLVRRACVLGSVAIQLVDSQADGCEGVWVLTTVATFEAGVIQNDSYEILLGSNENPITLYDWRKDSDSVDL